MYKCIYGMFIPWLKWCCKCYLSFDYFNEKIKLRRLLFIFIGRYWYCDWTNYLWRKSYDNYWKKYFNSWLFKGICCLIFDSKLCLDIFCYRFTIEYSFLRVGSFFWSLRCDENLTYTRNILGNWRTLKHYITY